MLLAFERMLIFPASSAGQSWQDPPDSRIRDVWLKSSAGDRIHAWWLPRPDARLTVLYSHGNAGNLSWRGKAIVGWSDKLDASVLIYDYPGYGKSEGSPSEAGCYAAAGAAWSWLTGEQKIAEGDVLLLGVSLGGSMAVELARQHPHRALVLAKAFSSIPDMAQSMYPWLPARYFVRTRFDNLSKIADCRGPLFMTHGRGDRLIPLSQGERMFERHPGPKEFLRDDGDHNDAMPADFFPRLRKFLDEHPKSP